MAVIQETNKLTISADGQSDVLDLGQYNYKVFVKYAGGASGTLTMKMGDQEDELISVPTPDGAGGVEATFTADKVFEISGGGLLGFSASGLSGTILVTITELFA